MPGTEPQTLVSTLIALSVFGLVFSVWMFWLVAWTMRKHRRARQTARRLGIEPEAPPQATRVLRLWREGREAGTTVVAHERVRGLGILHWLNRVREDAGLAQPTGSLISMFLTAAAGVFAISMVFTGSIWISIAASLMVPQVTWIVVAERISHRTATFERQLVDALELAARSLRVGHPLAAAFRLISDEISAPVGTIFAEIVQQQGLGSSLEQSMQRSARNIRNADFRLFATSIMIQLRSGGNLAEMMERLAFVIRERMRLARRVRVLTAQTQFSKRILLALPFFLFVILNILNPQYMRPLYSTTTGQTLLLIAAVGLILGAWVMNRLAVLRS